jgi:hypothetical protein
MSAEKSDRTRSAKAKDELYKEIQNPEFDSARALRKLRNELPWKDWLMVDFLRYWYIIGALALEGFLTLELARIYHVKDVLGILSLGFIALAVGIIAYVGYSILWPSGGLTRLEAQKKILRKFRRRRRFS